jgi:hypothetical protein
LAPQVFAVILKKAGRSRLDDVEVNLVLDFLLLDLVLDLEAVFSSIDVHVLWQGGTGLLTLNLGLGQGLLRALSIPRNLGFGSRLRFARWRLSVLRLFGIVHHRLLLAFALILIHDVEILEFLPFFFSSRSQRLHVLLVVVLNVLDLTRSRSLGFGLRTVLSRLLPLLLSKDLVTTAPDLL